MTEPLAALVSSIIKFAIMVRGKSVVEAIFTANAAVSTLHTLSPSVFVRGVVVEGDSHHEEQETTVA